MKTTTKLMFGALLAVPTMFMVGCQKQIATEEATASRSVNQLGKDVTGNGGPSGGHFTLNIIGVPKEKSALMQSKDYSEKQIGRRIFVPMSGQSKIMLTEGEFAVLDANGTDGEAAFRLPDPDLTPEVDGDPVTGTAYSVFARTLGTPGGSAAMVTCAKSDIYVDPVSGATYTAILCSEEVLNVERTAGRSKFTDVSKYLLTIYVDIDGAGPLTSKRYNLFDPELYDYFWKYDNNGLKLLQLRFYPIPSTGMTP